MAEEFENLELRDENTGETETFTPVDTTARQQIEELNETLMQSGIGGRNYLFNTKDLTLDGSLRTYASSSLSPSIEIDSNGFGILKGTSSGGYAYFGFRTNINNVIEEPLEGQKMIFSMDAKSDNWKNSRSYFRPMLSICKINTSNNISRCYYYFIDTDAQGYLDTNMEKWTKLFFPFTVPSVSDMSTDQTYDEGQENFYCIQIWTSTSSGNSLWIRKPKLELGNIPTDWTPAPEDFWYDLDQLKE